MRNILSVTLLFCFSISLSYSQCFDCVKTYGGPLAGDIKDLKESVDGVYLLTGKAIYKHDFDCNLLWMREINEYDVYINKIVSDNLGNTYLLVSYTIGNNSSPGPFDFNGFIVYPGLNLYKLNTNGNIIWNRHIGDRVSNRSTNIGIHNNMLYIIGSFYDYININGEVSFNFPYTDHPRAFVAKYGLMGNLIDAQHYGNGFDNYTSSEVDDKGNIYLTRYYQGGYSHSDIDKIGSDLQLIWSKEISNDTNVSAQLIYIPTKLYYNNSNAKLYLWGAYRGTTNILGNLITSVDNNFQSLLTEYNPLNGNFERMKKIDNSSRIYLPSVSGSFTGNTGYIAGNNNSLYILSGFSGEMSFPNATISSTPHQYGFSDELVLFKINLTNFDSEFILKSYGVPNQNQPIDFPGPIIFHNNDLYLTSNYNNRPLTINGSQVSMDENHDTLLYKYVINDNINLGLIEVSNTCLNNTTDFSLIGSFDTISWDFGDPNSLDNVSFIYNPQHQFSSSGNYHVTATVTCGNDSQIVERDIVITNVPLINSINPIYACESSIGSGLSNTFDTSNIESQVLQGQNGMVISYFDSYENKLPSPLPNPYSNSVQNKETITVRIANQNNLDCYAESSFDLIVNILPMTYIIEDVFSCDDDNDGITDFDVSHVETNLLVGQMGMTVEYFYENGQQLPVPLPNTIFNTIPNEETILARITNPNTNCYNEARFKLIVNPLPIANTLSELIGCDDNNDGISEYFDTSNIESQTLGNQTGLQVSYFDVNGNPLPSPLPNPYTNTISNEELIIVRVTNPITTCFSETSVTLKTASQPQINQPQTLYACDLGNGFANFDLADIETEIIGNQSGLKVTYFDSGNNQLPSPLASTFRNTIAWSQTIYVRVENELNGLCYSETSFNLIVNQLPLVSINDSYFLCNLEPSLGISVESNFDTYNWEYQDGTLISSTYQTDLIHAGNYTLTVGQNNNGIYCENSFDFKLIRSELPSIVNVEYNELSDDNYIKINASSDGDFEYSIDGINYQSSNLFSNVSGGIYMVSVRDALGCGEDFEEVVIIDYPKYFTPNGDGVNDSWQIKGIRDYPNTEIFIYDRYGKLLKQIFAKDEGWDGTFRGEKLTATDYWFTVKLTDSKTFTGHFALKR